MIPMQKGSVLHLCTKFQWIALFIQKLLGESQNFEIGSRDPGHTHLGVVLRRRVRPPSLYRTWSRLLNSFKSYQGVSKFGN